VLFDHVTCEHDHEVGVLDHITEFGQLVARVDRNDDGAEQRRAKQRLDELLAIRHQQSDVIAGTYPELPQTARHVPGSVQELAVAEALLGKHERGAIWVQSSSADQ
jgi:hypothetical protein